MKPSIDSKPGLARHQPSILEQVSALADGTRSRILMLLEHRELTVGELCSVLQLPQSTVSRHLKALAEHGWVVARREGNSRFYSLEMTDRVSSHELLWRLIREEVAATPLARQDQQRLIQVLAERRKKSRHFFSSAAGEWDRLREELFGQGFDRLGLLGLVEEDWVVGDLGCGTGQVSEDLSPFVRRVIAIDSSGAMLQTAGQRFESIPNVELRQGELESLPIGARELDAAILFLVLHHVSEPSRVLREVARVMRPAGRVLVVDMMPHDREDYRRQMGHVWLGFSEAFLGQQLSETGFERVQYRPLPANPAAKGPNLFMARGRRLAKAVGEPPASKSGLLDGPPGGPPQR